MVDLSEYTELSDPFAVKYVKALQQVADEALMHVLYVRGYRGELLVPGEVEPAPEPVVKPEPEPAPKKKPVKAPAKSPAKKKA